MSISDALSKWIVTVPSSTHEDKLYLTTTYAHIRDKFILFDEVPHTYYVFDPVTERPIKDPISVTTFVHHFFEKFDADAVIANMKPKQPGEKYYGMTSDEIKDSWEKNRIDASSKGTKMHRKIELFYNKLASSRDAEYKEKPLNPADEAIVNEKTREYEYFQEFHQNEIAEAEWQIYRTEWRIWCAELGITGTIDCVFIPNLSKPNEVIIYDWKRSKQIKHNSFGGKKALKPINHLEDCNFVQYSLQLHTYKYILEKNYGVRVVGMYLGVFHPDNDSYIIEKIPAHYAEDLKKLVECRLKELKESKAGAH